MSDGFYICCGLVASAGIVCWTIVKCFSLWLTTPRHIHNFGRVDNVHMSPEQFAEFTKTGEK